MEEEIGAWCGSFVRPTEGRSDVKAVPSESQRLVPFIHQVGGHYGILLYDEHTICKPAFQRELDNYRYMAPVLGKFMPKFKGVTKVSIEKKGDGRVTFSASPESSQVCERVEKGESANIELELSPTQDEPAESIHNSTSDGEIVEGTFCHNSDSNKKLHNQRAETVDHAPWKRSHSSPHLGTYGDGVGDISNTVFEDVTDYSFCRHGRGLNPWSLRCQKYEVSRHNIEDETHAKIQTDYLLLENIAVNYKCPSIIDLKIGTRCYGDDLSEEKKQLNMARAADSTTSTLGVRFGGMQVYQADKGRYMCCNKKYGNTLSEEHLRKEVSRFVYPQHSFHGEILHTIVAGLEDLKAVISQQEGCRFFGCSVLIIYEGMDCGGQTGEGGHIPSPTQTGHISHDHPHIRENTCDPKCVYCKGKGQVQVKVIDFAHASAVEVQSSDGVSYQGIDKGFIYGLENLIELLQAVTCGRDLS